MVFGLRDSKISQRVHLHHQLFFLKHFCFILNVGRCNIEGELDTSDFLIIDEETISLLIIGNNITSIADNTIDSWNNLHP